MTIRIYANIPHAHESIKYPSSSLVESLLDWNKIHLLNYLFIFFYLESIRFQSHMLEMD